MNPFIRTRVKTGASRLLFSQPMPAKFANVCFQTFIANGLGTTPLYTRLKVAQAGFYFLGTYAECARGRLRLQVVAC